MRQGYLCTILLTKHPIYYYNLSGREKVCIFDCNKGTFMFIHLPKVGRNENKNNFDNPRLFNPAV